MWNENAKAMMFACKTGFMDILFILFWFLLYCGYADIEFEEWRETFIRI